LRVEKICMGSCDKRTLACEAEESPLLDAIAKEWLVKTKQAGKGLSGPVVIWEVWKSVIALQILVVPGNKVKLTM
jgi:hypothetical protein